MKQINNILLTLVLLCFSQLKAVAQENKKVSVIAWDGVIVAGYVYSGAYVNMGGPSVKLIKKPFSIGVGMLPSIRIKEDKVPASATKNSTFSPSLGFGLTASYKHFAMQIPLYYNTKNTISNGKWLVGFGIGYKF